MSHEAPGQSNEWFTPPHIFDALGCVFDEDVACPKDLTHVHTPAKTFFSEGSLEREWKGFVWMNPPFGTKKDKAQWLKKFFDHGDGIALTPDRTCSLWWHEAFNRADAVLFTKGRPKFIRPSGEVGGSPGANVCLWASGHNGIWALERAEKIGLGALAYTPKSRGERRPFLGKHKSERS